MVLRRRRLTPATVMAAAAANKNENVKWTLTAWTMTCWTTFCFRACPISLGRQIIRTTANRRCHKQHPRAIQCLANGIGTLSGRPIKVSAGTIMLQQRTQMQIVVNRQMDRPDQVLDRIRPANRIRAGEYWEMKIVFFSNFYKLIKFIELMRVNRKLKLSHRTGHRIRPAKFGPL